VESGDTEPLGADGSEVSAEAAALDEVDEASELFPAGPDELDEPDEWGEPRGEAAANGRLVPPSDDPRAAPAGTGSLLEPRTLLRRAEEEVGRIVDRVLAPVRGARALFPPWRRTPPKK